MNEKNTKTTAEKLVKFGLKEGADQVEVSVREGTDFSVEVRKGKIEKLEEAGTRSLAVRVIKDQKSATATSSKFDLEPLKDLVRGAVKRTVFGDRDEYLGLPENREIPTDSAALKLFDSRVLEMAPREKIDLARRLEDLALRMDRRINNSYGARLHSHFGTYYLFNSRGFGGSYRSSRWSMGVYLQAGPTNNSVQGGWNTAGRFFRQLEPLESVAATAVERTVRQLNPRKVETQKVPVVVEPGQGIGLLYFLYQCIDGRTVSQKRSFLADRLTRLVAHSRVNVVDDGRMPEKLGSRPFDREGVPTRRTQVIKDGILNSFLTDTYTARKLGQTSTGNASGLNNFYLQAGPHSPGEICRSVKKGLLLTLTMGQGTNPITGDISRGAGGMWIEDGEIVYPVAEITISGNLGDILQNVEMVGNDLEFRGRVACPTLKVGEMTVGGR